MTKGNIVSCAFVIEPNSNRKTRLVSALSELRLAEVSRSISLKKFLLSCSFNRKSYGGREPVGVLNFISFPR